MNNNTITKNPGWLTKLIKKWNAEKTTFEEAPFPTNGRVKVSKDFAKIVALIKAIDKYVPFEKIMDDLSLTEDMLYSLLNEAVLKGVKFDLDYQVENTISAEKVKTIYDFFMNKAQSESIEDAMNALGAGFSYAEVCFVRNKMISERK